MSEIISLDSIRDRKDRVEASNRRTMASVKQLQKASEEQIHAVRNYQKSITALKQSIERLEMGWRDYDAALAEINAKPAEGHS